MQVIQTNVQSLNAQRNLNQSGSALNVALQRLSSGLRINSAKDDAAGLAISERFTGQIRGMDQARRNSNDGVSLAQTAEGALGQMGNILQRVRELAVQSANATNSASDRQAINQEVGQLVAELDRFSTQTEFNGLRLLDGSFASATFQVGANAQQTVTATTANFRTTNYGTNQVGKVDSGTSTARITTDIGPNSGTVIATSGALVLRGAASGQVDLAVTDSARSIADKINAQSQTGIKASARTESNLFFGASGSYTLDVTGTNSSAQAVTFSLSATNTAAGLADAVTAFNNQSSKTGITAKLNDTNTGIVLRLDSGDNINLAVATATSAAGDVIYQIPTGGKITAGTSGSMTIGGQIILDSDKSFSIASSSTLGGYIGGNFLSTGTTRSSAMQAVSTLDVTTFENATQAIRIVDQALNAVNNQRAAFGALQSRFEATVGQLQTSSENLAAARSRIRDTDFASETANLTRSQILQQAGTAMLAQANSLPQNVLSLLRG